MNLISRNELAKRQGLPRRDFLKLGALGSATLASWPLLGKADSLSPELAKAVDSLEPYFTPTTAFHDVSRGKPIPHKLPEDKKREVGLTRDTWKLEVIADPENPAKLGRPLTKADNTALDFKDLLELGEKQAVRFPMIMTCLNIGRPLGTGLWEGVPLREVIWKAQPLENLRRVFYYGYHNDDPKQIFQSSLPIGRVLEDPFGLPPVILCYKLNGEWLDSVRGGPVRIIVPEHYGFKSVKWITHVVLTNQPFANDTYAEGNNDVDSPLKTFAGVLSVSKEVKAGQPIPVTGYAQAGISGLAKVQVWVAPNATKKVADDPYFLKAPWQDATLQPPPQHWGATPEGKIPTNTLGFDAVGKPLVWPLKLTKAHWTALLPGLPAGNYTLRCRTIDQQGQAQPMPRPFRKSGRAAIEEIVIKVTV
jgi:DMSO/TMAO reductase YedYZ molybdopterin-dependent catalytic subunit